jgi:allophanate hydrolase
MLDAARLLYEGPWVAERYAAIRPFIEAHPEALHPVTRQIIAPAIGRSAVEAFEAQYRLQALKRTADKVTATVDFVLTPTAGTLRAPAPAAIGCGRSRRTSRGTLPRPQGQTFPP